MSPVPAVTTPSAAPATLPKQFLDWFASRGWAPHAHQLQMLAAAEAGQSALLIAPTGGGKTLAGFLPSLVDLATNPDWRAGAGTRAPDRAPGRQATPSEHLSEANGREIQKQQGLHTLYISPLKALAVDIHRNLQQPIDEMGLAISAESRTGDTPQSKRQRQRRSPPQLLMTTPESLALLLSYTDAPQVFRNLRCVIVDELHAIEENKRGDLLSLALARLTVLAPHSRRVGLSATVADPDRLQRWISPTADGTGVAMVRGRDSAKPDLTILVNEEHLPWSGHMGVFALPKVYDLIQQATTTLVFVNTRAQAEIIFQELWRLNEANLPIALHHGSLSPEQRRKVEAMMGRGGLRAVVATSSLDLGIDWAAVDLVVQIGAPKGSTRLLQRIGRSNHRMDEPSRAVLVPTNRFEVLECRAAQAAVAEGTLDGLPARPGALDVLAQHILGMACSVPFTADALFAEVRRAGPYARLPRRDFDDVLNFVATGGYALGGYERYRRLRLDDGAYTVADPVMVRRYRMNVGTIVETPMLKVRLGRGRVLGEIEESFVAGLTPGDTFVFAGRTLRFERVHEMSVETTVAVGDARVPAYNGGRFPLSTHLADRVRALLADPSDWHSLPPLVREWLEVQRWRSQMPARDGLLVETFPRGKKWYLVAYTFEGRNAHQTLGMLLTRRMERAGFGPLGFVATDYSIAVWSLREATDMDALFDEDMLGDDLEAWMADSSLLRRTFRNVAVIAGLIERRHPGQQKTSRQVTFNSDLIYDVLRSHEPNHVLLRATRADAAAGLTDIRRLAGLLARVRGHIQHRSLDRVSPLAVPVLLEVGKESVYGAAVEDLLEEQADDLVAEAMSGADAPTLPL